MRIPNLVLGGLMFFSWACSHKVELSPPKEPITVNLNVKIDHEVRVKVERDLEQVISPDSKLF